MKWFWSNANFIVVEEPVRWVKACLGLFFLGFLEMARTKPSFTDCYLEKLVFNEDLLTSIFAVYLRNYNPDIFLCFRFKQ